MCKKSFITSLLLLVFIPGCLAQGIPEILSDQNEGKNNYLPDFSYAGYHNGEVELPHITDQVILATDYGLVSNDLSECPPGCASCGARIQCHMLNQIV